MQISKSSESLTASHVSLPLGSTPVMMSSDAGGSSGEVTYRGVRKRKWGKWVSEVRLPNSRDRIWLGSYDSPEKAARAFDAASVCLRGRRARLNFPNNPPSIPTAPSMTPQEIQVLAARHAHYTQAGAPAMTTAAATLTPIETSAANSPTMSTAGNSPDMSVSEASEEAAAAMATTDWSYFDFMPESFPVIDEFCYDFIAPVSGTAGPTDGAADEGGGGFGTTMSLWNF